MLFVLVCVVRRCSSLTAPQFGYIYPYMCSSYPISGTVCYLECRHGFQSNGGVTVLQCGNNGKWNQNVSSTLQCKGTSKQKMEKCCFSKTRFLGKSWPPLATSLTECSLVQVVWCDSIKVEFSHICCTADVDPPDFMSCPSDIRASINENSSALVNWTFPVATDNSNQAPQITVSPAGATSPYTFSLSTLITYTATDASGNKAECSFKVILQGQKVFLIEKAGPGGQDGWMMALHLIYCLKNEQKCIIRFKNARRSLK